MLGNAAAALQRRILEQEEMVAAIRKSEHSARQAVYRERKRARDDCFSDHWILLALVWYLCQSWSIVAMVCKSQCPAAAEAAPAANWNALLDHIKSHVDNPALTLRVALIAAARPACSVFHKAALLVAEASVILWLAETNQRGVAASSAQLVTVLRRSWPSRGRTARSQSFLLRLRHNSKCLATWANDLRRRWRIRWRRLTTRPEMSREEIARKVIVFFCFIF
jgi:hypothetical protein